MPGGNEYDDLPYESHAYGQTHPDHIGAVGRLVGLACRPVDEARVLELGCGEGGNLIPMAYAAPRGRFVGVDLSGRQIEVAIDEARRLGLENVEFVHASITELVPETLGKFDYVICHGLYSWVPAEVREAILRITGAVLADDGVAYISYNTKPGWTIRTAVREMMEFHNRKRTDNNARVEQGRAFLDWLIEGWGDLGGAWREAVQVEAKRIAGLPDWYVLHDNLAAVNQPFWLHEFVMAADAQGLGYLGDAIPAVMFPSNYPDKLAQTLIESGADQWVVEQYFDFASFRGFRHTLLWTGKVDIDRRLVADKLDQLLLVIRASPQGEVVYTDDSEVTFTSADGVEVTTTDPAIKAALSYGATHGPRAATLDALNAWVASQTGLEATPELRHKLAVNLLHGVARDVVLPRLADRPFVMTPGERPLALPYARRQVEKGIRSATSFVHEQVRLSPFDRELLLGCDGTRDRDGLVAFLLQAVKEGRIEVMGPQGPFQSEAEAEEGIRIGLVSAIAALGARAMFVA